MALQELPYWTLSLSFKDRDHNIGQVQMYVARTVLLADIVDALDATIIGRISALSDATLVGYSLATGSVDNVPALAAETSDVERKGVFTFRGANNRPVTLQIPSIRNSLVVDRTNTILATDAAVAAFTGMMTDGAVLGAVRPITVTGSDVVTFVQALKRHRASSKG